MVPDVVVASNRGAGHHPGVTEAKLARQLVHSAVAKTTRAQRARTTEPGKQITKVGHQMDSTTPLQTLHPLLPLQYPPDPLPLHTSLKTQHLPQPPRPPLAAPADSTLSPRGPNHAPSASTPTHPSDAPTLTPSSNDPTPTTPHPTQTALLARRSCLAPRGCPLVSGLLLSADGPVAPSASGVGWWEWGH